MKIGLLLLSDIHIKSAADFCVSQVGKLVAASRTVTNDCDNIIISVSGDIAFSGKKEEYFVAKKYLSEIKDGIIKENNVVSEIPFILVPGNHDCNFEENQARDYILNSVSKLDEIKDQTVIDILLSTQNEFWEFYREINGAIPLSKLSYTIRVPLSNGHSFDFLCYNSSILSKIEEQQGCLIIPSNCFLTPDSSGDVLSASVFHHNSGWLSSSTDGNNRKMFENHVFSTSHLVICGHEHQTDIKLQSSFGEHNELIYLEGAALQNRGRDSEFSIVVLDTESGIIEVHEFSYSFNSTHPEQSRYLESKFREDTLSSKNIGLFVNDSFEKYLNKLVVPLHHPRKPDITLSDVFVYPDLDPIQTGEIENQNYVDANTLTSLYPNSVLLLFGESQSGKTSLLHYLYLAFIKKGIFPLLIKGKDIKDPNINDLLRKAYKEQYNSKECSYEIYQQLEKDKRIILIDDLSSSVLNDIGKEDLYFRLLKQCCEVIASNNDSLSFGQIHSTSVDFSVKKYRIVYLGSVKRNDLVTKWVNIGKNPKTIEITELEQEIRLTFDQLNNLLGEQFLPPYPFYVLSLLQSLNEAMKPFDTQPTYYAYCYNSILITSLNSVGLGPDIQKEFLNFLHFLAYKMFDRENVVNKRRLTSDEFKTIFEDYTSQFYFSNDIKSTLEILAASNLFLTEEETGLYKFAYKYLYFYLVAQELSKIVSGDKGKAIIESLCSSSHKEESANILLFLVYHTEDLSVIKMLIKTSTVPFEQYEPITLNLEDKLFDRLNSLVAKIEHKILIADNDPEEERKKELKGRDDYNKALSKNKLSQKDIQEIEKSPMIIDLNKALRSIKILGQIVKNQKAGLGKSVLNELLVETYNATFRVISFYGDFIEKGENEVFAEIEKECANECSRAEIKKNVQGFFMSMLYRFCLQCFSNLALSVGSQNADSIYDNVARTINTPAADLITFTIKSYYGPMDVAELQKLVSKYANNPMALHILRARVLSYVYNNSLPQQKKQKIGEICDMKVIYKNQIAR